jgi:hypothetical protein
MNCYKEDEKQNPKLDLKSDEENKSRDRIGNEFLQMLDSRIC